MGSDRNEILGKLDHLLHHWMEHNESHGEGYATWMERARAAGMEGAAEEIGRALELSREMNSCFARAREMLKEGDDV